MAEPTETPETATAPTAPETPPVPKALGAPQLELPETKPDLGTSALDRPVIYLLQSAVRGRDNRTARALVPGRQPFVQRFAGGKIIVRRARPARISEAVLIANLVEIKAAAVRHQVVVTTADGKSVDLNTFEVGKLAARSPRPNPPLDSAKNDKNQNIGYNVPGSPEGTTVDSPLPELLKPNPVFRGEENDPETQPLPERSRAVLNELLEEDTHQRSDGGEHVEGDPDFEPDVDPEPETTPGLSPSTSPEASHHRKHHKAKKRGHS